MADADAATATTIGYSNTPVKLADWKRVDFPQSFLQFANGTVSANAPYVVMLLCDYLIVDDSGQMIFKG